MAHGDASKTQKEWARLAVRMGWKITFRGGHQMWWSPAGVRVTVPSTPGKGRSGNNTRAALRRAGLPI